MRKLKLRIAIWLLGVVLAVVGGAWKWEKPPHRVAGWTWDEASLSDTWTPDAEPPSDFV